MLSDGRVIAVGTVVTGHLIEMRGKKFAQFNLPREQEKFVNNTLEYAFREKDVILGDIQFPPLKVSCRGKTVVMVVRGVGYREDLQVLAPFIQEAASVLVGVDGAPTPCSKRDTGPTSSSGIWTASLMPHCAAGPSSSPTPIPTGAVPVAERLANLGWSSRWCLRRAPAKTWLCSWPMRMGADLIVLVGSHSNMIDFLEKGRPGMASTLLDPLEDRAHLLDAKKVSELYRPKTTYGALPLLLAAMIPSCSLWDSHLLGGTICACSGCSCACLRGGCK